MYALKYELQHHVNWNKKASNLIKQRTWTNWWMDGPFKSMHALER